MTVENQSGCECGRLHHCFQTSPFLRAEISGVARRPGVNVVKVLRFKLTPSLQCLAVARRWNIRADKLPAQSGGSVSEVQDRECCE